MYKLDVLQNKRIKKDFEKAWPFLYLMEYGFGVKEKICKKKS